MYQVRHAQRHARVHRARKPDAAAGAVPASGFAPEAPADSKPVAGTRMGRKKHAPAVPALVVPVTVTMRIRFAVYYQSPASTPPSQTTTASVWDNLQAITLANAAAGIEPRGPGAPTQYGMYGARLWRNLRTMNDVTRTAK